METPVETHMPFILAQRLTGGRVCPGVGLGADVGDSEPLVGTPTLVGEEVKELGVGEGVGLPEGDVP